MPGNVTADLPIWVQYAIYIFATFFGIIFAVLKGWAKATNQGAPAGEATVIAGSFADKRATEQLTIQIEDLRKAIQEASSDLHRDIRDLQRSVEDNTAALDRNSKHFRF